MEVVIQHERPLGLGYLSQFLREVDDVTKKHLGQEHGDWAAIPEIGRIETGSLIVTISLGAVGAAGVAKAAWAVFKHFHVQWIEKRRRDEEWEREDRVREVSERREDMLRSQHRCSELDILVEVVTGKLVEPKRPALDPRIKNIVVVTQAVRIDFNDEADKQPPPPPLMP